MSRPKRESDLSKAQMPLPEPGPADRRPVPRGVVEHLQRLILRGGLKPGDRLPPQRELAEQLGVSRPSLREGLTVLETMGLVSVRVGSGVFVAPSEARAPLWRFSDRCSPSDVYEARYGLESFATSLAAANMDEAAARRLSACVEEMRRALDAQDIVGLATSDAEFHDLVFELCGNPVLADMYRPMRDIMVESQRLPMARRTRLDETVKEHEIIRDRLIAKDREGAASAMRAHIKAAAARYGVELDVD
jgi:GntR family transcriptional repressor for pyruvate dehydrogenase complex